MQHLNLPDHGVKHKQGDAGPEVFDPSRRKWVALTPEEWVRQHFLLHLVHDLGCPLSLISTEKTITLNGLTKRADIVVHGAHGEPVALVECKAPEVRITQAAVDQAVRYNMVFKVRWLLVTNGVQHHCWAIDRATGAVHPVRHIPDHRTMIGEEV